MDYKKLQNGSDIRGVALEGIEGQHVNLTEQACRDIGRGFALWLREKENKTSFRVAVGRDSRLSGQQLCAWICEAMAQEGLSVTDLGMASTPAMFMPEEIAVTVMTPISVRSAEPLPPEKSVPPSATAEMAIIYRLSPMVGTELLSL